MRLRKDNSLVVLFIRNYASYSATWIWYIALITGNQVHVNMKNTLAGGFPNINPNIISVRMISFFHDLFNRICQVKEILSLFL